MELRRPCKLEEEAQACNTPDKTQDTITWFCAPSKVKQDQRKLFLLKSSIVKLKQQIRQKRDGRRGFQVEVENGDD
ncbi:MAG: hypothetical protein DMG62_24095 [Acidobacteria bacterium]|nr:MAG: hypothetical protein DMG62_24095 [Acidobacteriota bacterium]